MNNPPFEPERRLFLHGGAAAAVAASPRRAQSAEVQGGISPLMHDLRVYRKYREQPCRRRCSKLLNICSTRWRSMISGSRPLPGKLAIAYVKQLGGTPEAACRVRASLPMS